MLERFAKRYFIWKSNNSVSEPRCETRHKFDLILDLNYMIKCAINLILILHNFIPCSNAIRTFVAPYVCDARLKLKYHIFMHFTLFYEKSYITRNSRIQSSNWCITSLSFVKNDRGHHQSTYFLFYYTVSSRSFKSVAECWKLFGDLIHDSQVLKLKSKYLQYYYLIIIDPFIVYQIFPLETFGQIDFKI